MTEGMPAVTHPERKGPGGGRGERTACETSVTWSENFLTGENGMEPGAEVLFTRLTEFLIVLKNSECKTSVIKSLKIAYISGVTKNVKNLATFPSSQKTEKKSRENRAALILSGPRWRVLGLSAVCF